MGFLMALRAEGDQIFRGIITQTTPRLNVVDLKIFRSSAELAAPAIPLQYLTAELAIRLGLKLQAWSLGSNHRYGATRTFARSCSRCNTGRPSNSRVRENSRVSWSPVSKLTPARKSAQIISKQ